MYSNFGIPILRKAFFWALFVPLLLNGQESRLPILKEKLELNRQLLGKGREINLIYDILQDRYGFLWFGTFQGMVRYDGYNLVHFEPGPEDPTALQHKTIIKIKEGPDGNIWALSGQGLVHVYNQQQDAFQVVTSLDGDSLLRFPDKGTCIMDPDIAGNVWMADKNGLLQFRKRNNGTGYQVRRHHIGPGDKPEEGHSVNTLLLAHDQKLWLGTETGLAYYNVDKGQVERVETGCKVPVSCLAETRSGKIAMGTPNSGICLYGPKTRTAVQYLPDDENPGSIAGSAVKNMEADGKGNIWLLAGDAEAQTYTLQRFDPETESFQSYHQPFHPTRNVMGRVRSYVRLYVSQDGALWVYDRSGLIKFDPYRKVFIEYQLEEIFDNLSLINCFFQDRTGVVWLGTSGNGLLKHAPTAWKFDILHPSFTNSSKKRGNFIQSPIFEDSRGQLWAGTQYGTTRYRFDKNDQPVKVGEYPFLSQEFLEDGKGNLFINTGEHIKCYDLNTGEFQTFASLPFTLKPPYALSLLDTSGRFWFNSYGAGLYYFHPASGVFAHYQHHPGKEGVICSNYLNPESLQDKDGEIWISNVAGLDQYHPGSGTFTTWLKGVAAMHIHEDQDGLFWISTNGQGLYRFEKGSGVYKRYHPGNGYPFRTLFALLEDDKGCFWIGSDVGLIWFDPRTESFRLYDGSDGIPDGYFTQSAPCKRKNGEMFFPLLEGGFIRFHPDSLQLDEHPPATAIVRFKLFNREVQFGGNKAILPQSIWTTERLKLQHHQNVFSLEYAALHFVAPEDNRFAYMLEGIDRDWNEAGDQRIVNYAGLPPGEYTFRVKAANPDGLWSVEATSLDITILPPWWASGWAYSLYALLFGFALWAFYTFQRHRWRLKAQLAMEQREAERLKELDAVKTRLYTNITHEFRTPLTLILGMADQIKDNPERWFSQGISMIKRNGNKLLHFVNQMLELSKLEAGVVSMNFIQGDIIAYLKYLTESFHSMAEHKKISLRFQSEHEEFWMDYEPDKLMHIVTNLLSNAIKYTPEGGRVQLTVGSGQNAVGSEPYGFRCAQPYAVSSGQGSLATSYWLLLTVRDTGIGIPESQLPHIFNRFYRAEGHAVRNAEGLGIGLALAQELAKLLNGEIKVESTVGKGSAFTLFLPITRNAPLSREQPPVLPGHPIYPSPTAPLWEEEEPKKAGPLPVLLIVEDNDDVIQYLNASLEGRYTIKVAGNGREGLDKARALVPDIIISDVMMPEMDGFELCDKLKRDMRTSHIPIVLLTARSDITSRLEGLERGADVYLAKPFHKAELLVRLKNLIALRKQLQARYRNFTAPPPSDDPAFQMEDAFMKKLHSLLEARYSDENFDTASLCRALYISRAQLYRKLDALTGIPAASYLRSFRLRKARRLLQTTGLSVSEIAFRVGFRNLSHFSRSFRKEFGMNPSELRR